MKVKLLVSRAGDTPDGVSFSQKPGDVIDVDDAEGGRLVGAGQAEAVGGDDEKKAKGRKPKDQ